MPAVTSGSFGGGESGGGTGITSNQRKVFRDDFGGTALDTVGKWEILEQGASHSISVAQSKLYLSNAANQGANEVTRLRSKESFKIPCRLNIAHAVSARNQNVTFYIELVNAAGDMRAGVEIGFGGGNGDYYVRYFATNAGEYNPRSETDEYVLDQRFTSQLVIDVRPEQVIYNSRPSEKAASMSDAQHYAHFFSRIPDPDEEYYAQIRVVNGPANPNQSITLEMDHVLVTDIANLETVISGGRGGYTNTSAIPTVVLGTLNTTVTSGYITAKQDIKYSSFTPGAMAAGAIYTSSTQTCFNEARIRFGIYSDQAATLYIDEYFNGTWYVGDTITITAGEVIKVTTEPSMYYYRFRLVMGATASTETRINMARIPI